MVTYNGDTTNLTGVGSPNPVKLTIPNLNQIQDPAVQTALLRILQFVNNLSAPSSGGGGAYDSLTGPGETTTPGLLSQAGSFEITADVATGDSFATFYATVTGGSTTTAQCYLQCDNTAIGEGVNRIDLAASEVTTHGDLALTASHGAIWLQTSNDGIYLLSSAAGISIRSVGGAVTLECQTQYVAYGATYLSFFAAGAVVKQTVTGSKSGNAALASLLTALANYGLIIDSST